VTAKFVRHCSSLGIRRASVWALLIL